MQKKYYPYLDLLKFVCCIGIVGIHTWPLFYAVEPLKDWYEKLCPVFVSIFFCCFFHAVLAKDRIQQ